MCDDIHKEFINDLLDSRELVLNQNVTDEIVEDIVLRIKKWNDDDDLLSKESKSYKRENNPIGLYINSNGGDVGAMFSCISVIITSKTPVYTYCLGKAYSAGFAIFIAGHKRFAQMYSRFMVHQISYGTHGELQTHEETLDNEILSQELIDNFITTQTKITKKKLNEIRKTKTDWYFFACEESTKKLNVFHSFF